MLARASNGKRINRASLRQDLRNKFDALEPNESRKFCYETGTGEELEVTLAKGADWRSVEELSMCYRGNETFVMRVDMRDLAWHIENQYAELMNEVNF